MSAKKVIVTAVALCVAAGAVVGGIYAYKSYQQGQLVAEVSLVSDLSWGYWGDSSTSYGMVTNDSSQEVYLSDASTIKQVYVQEGDTVAVGDPLIEYDTSEVSLQIARKKLDLEQIANNIESAQHKLDVLKATKPVDKTRPTLEASTIEELEQQDSEQNTVPQTDEKDSRIYNYVTSDSVAFNASDRTAGTADNPYVYYCNGKAYVYGEFLNGLRESKKVAKFVVCEKDSNGRMKFADQTTDSTEAVDSTEAAAAVVFPIQNSAVEPVVFDGAKMPVAFDDGGMWYIFTGEEYVPSSSLADDYLDSFVEDVTDWVEPEGYTEEELSDAIREQEKQLKELDIQKRQGELELSSLQSSASDGVLYATVAGEVKSVGDPENYVQDGSAFLVVSGDSGLYVKGTISELLLDDITVGTTVTANSWETGNTFEATITEIGDYPVSGNSWGDGNPNVSYYSYIARIDDDLNLSNGEYVDLTIDTNQSEGGGIYLPKAYVRTEDGKSYCMIADENNKLKKQYIATGKTIYGSAVEVKSGVSEEDRIAFPYGKTAVEGAAVKDAEDTYYY